MTISRKMEDSDVVETNPLFRNKSFLLHERHSIDGIMPSSDVSEELDDDVSTSLERRFCTTRHKYSGSLGMFDPRRPMSADSLQSRHLREKLRHMDLHGVNDNKHKLRGKQLLTSQHCKHASLEDTDEDIFISSLRTRLASLPVSYTRKTVGKGGWVTVSGSSSPSSSVRSLSPVRTPRRRCNTYTDTNTVKYTCNGTSTVPHLGQIGRSARLPRDPVQPSRGSISDLSDKHSADEEDEEWDSFSSVQPSSHRPRSSTCPENRAFRRRARMMNRPATPPPSELSSRASSCSDMERADSLDALGSRTKYKHSLDREDSLPLVVEDQGDRNTEQIPSENT